MSKKQSTETSLSNQNINLMASGVKSLKEKLQAIYRAQDTLPKLIEDSSIPEQRMDDYYVNLEMLVYSVLSQLLCNICKTANI